MRLRRRESEADQSFTLFIHVIACGVKAIPAHRINASDRICLLVLFPQMNLLRSSLIAGAVRMTETRMSISESMRTGTVSPGDRACRSPSTVYVSGKRYATYRSREGMAERG